MAGKFNRANFYRKVTVDNVDQLDPLSFQWLSFPKFLGKRGVRVHTVTQDEAGNAQLVSYNEYKTTNLWWIICLVNNITKPLEEFIPGIELSIPKREDIEEFYQKIRFEGRKNASVSLNKVIA